MTLGIDTRSEEIASYLKEWEDNRATVKGERAMKGPGTRFLPKDEGMSDLAYENMKKRTPVFPGAARTFDGLKALATHKPAIITAPASVEDILKTITAQGYGLDNLAARIFGELLLTNFVGLVVDYPVAPAGITQAQAIAAGVRPYIGMYDAEHILGIETGVINNRQRVTRVRLSDDADNIRELRLDDGVYSVTKWRRIKGQWTPIETITPTKGGATIDEIPFTLVSTTEDFEPSKAPMADVCSINRQLFLASSNLAQCHWWISQPIPYVIKKLTESEGALSVAPGTVWRFDCLPSEAAVGFLEWSGAQVAELRNEVETLKADLAKNGLRMLADDRAANEAAETAAIRRASENAIVANFVRERDAGLNDALAWVAWWLDLEEGAITYEGSTDFNAVPLSDAALNFLKGLKESGDISRATLLDVVVAQKILPETYDKEVDAEIIAQELADRPPAIVMPNAFGSANDNAGQDDEDAS
ncbi:MULTISPECIES: DUF4055 domain-containing protein [Sphingomonas]|uniref:DUF4055 domain-containing protein n=1 Tax=Sphingomonas TaxID=13687 RepID=UPI000F7DF200|nr:DUF4055 domain-containing protein [Sphingomonas sp. ABOLF]RSV14632.1 DUF4055 domain-containing protein [Sphingomonas sp. ABOLF]GLK19234.1 hypothetical protein GCM10017606_00600 [Microbacterium terregens]